MLGDLLGMARKSSGRFVQWLKLVEPQMAEQVAEAAERDQLTTSGYVRVAIADFSRFANEEDWATLSSTLKNTDDPGAACLLAMVHWRLTRTFCEAHSSGAHTH